LTEPPIAESALRAYGRSLAERDARGSLAVRTLAAEWYDRSPATAVELARSLVAARDTARAVRILQNAVRVDPQDAEVLQFLREIGGRLR
jgi:Flp pilus assembly protein TadD